LFVFPRRWIILIFGWTKNPPPPHSRKKRDDPPNKGIAAADFFGIPPREQVPGGNPTQAGVGGGWVGGGWGGWFCGVGGLLGVRAGGPPGGWGGGGRLPCKNWPTVTPPGKNGQWLCFFALCRPRGADFFSPNPSPTAAGAGAGQVQSSMCLSAAKPQHT